MQPTLISHTLCPYVQRAAIVLAEKEVPFERRDVDLAHKPAWFKALSPLGKTPVLLVGNQAIFESAVICEYLDDTLLPRLHPADALARARHRAWVEFGSSVLNSIAGYYNAPDAATLDMRRQELLQKFSLLEGEMENTSSGNGPWFGGASFCIVDAAFAPVFRYFDAFEALGETGWFDALPRLQAWRAALAGRASVQRAVVADFAERLRDFLARRGSELGRRVRPQVLASPRCRSSACT